MTASDAPCFARDDMSIASRKARRERARSSGKTKDRRQVPRAGNLGPTPERLAKGDVVRGTSGQHLVQGAMERLRDARPVPPTKAQAVLDRLHKRVALDSDPGMNDRMYEAGCKYESVVHAAGLTGVAAQNLLSCGGGSGDPASAMPATEHVHRQREMLRRAWAIMGSKTASAVHALLVEARDAEGVGRTVSSFVRRDMCIAAASTALRIGLSQLVDAKWA